MNWNEAGESGTGAQARGELLRSIGRFLPRAAVIFMAGVAAAEWLPLLLGKELGKENELLRALGRVGFVVGELVMVGIFIAASGVFTAKGRPAMREFLRDLLQETGKLLQIGRRQRWRITSSILAHVLAGLRITKLLAEQRARRRAASVRRSEGELLTEAFLVRRSARVVLGCSMLVTGYIGYTAWTAVAGIEREGGVFVLIGVVALGLMVDHTILERRVRAGVFGSSLSEVRELLRFIEAAARSAPGGRPPRLAVGDIEVPNPAPAQAPAGAVGQAV